MRLSRGFGDLVRSVHVQSAAKGAKSCRPSQ